MATTSVNAIEGVRQAAAPTTATQTAAQKASLDYSSFLKLLIAQLQNQDPMQPMDSSDYVAQLATFSQVEQSIQSNDRLSELLTSSLISQAGSIVGLQIESADGSIKGEVASARIEKGGVVAQLTDGREVEIGAGVIVGRSPS